VMITISSTIQMALLDSVMMMLITMEIMPLIIVRKSSRV